MLQTKTKAKFSSLISNPIVIFIQRRIYQESLILKNSGSFFSPFYNIFFYYYFILFYFLQIYFVKALEIKFVFMYMRLCPAMFDIYCLFLSSLADGIEIRRDLYLDVFWRLTWEKHVIINTSFRLLLIVSDNNDKILIRSIIKWLENTRKQRIFL